MCAYSWGRDDRDSDDGVGHDYKSARKEYEAPKRAEVVLVEHDDEERSRGRSRHEIKSPVGKTISTESTHPIVVALDGTGSMSTWPSIIKEKMPLLGKEVERYIDDYAISFCVFGDVVVDDYALQFEEFGKGEELDKYIDNLYPEGDGGDSPEDHSIVAYAYLDHCKIDKAVKPLLFLITDTNCHRTLSKSAIKKYTGDIVQDEQDSETLLRALGEKFIVYVILKDETRSIVNYWTEIYGEQRIKPIEEPRDIVELIIGVVANEMGEFDDFKMRSKSRHADMPDRVDRVTKSVMSGSKKAEEGKSKVASHMDEGVSKRLV